MYTRLLSASAAVLLSLLASSCGKNSDLGTETAQSATLSLVALPCQEYGYDMNNPAFHCGTVAMGGDSDFQVLFRLDGFTEIQQKQLKAGIDLALRAFRIHRQENPDLLTNCVERLASKDFAPIGSAGTSFPSWSDIKTKVFWAMTAPTFNFRVLNVERQPVVISAINVPSEDGNRYVMGEAYIGHDAIPNSGDSWDTKNMNISMNIAALDSGYFHGMDFAGTIWHEFMHRKGWTHESGYEGSFIKQVGICIATDGAAGSIGFGLTEAWKPEMID